MRALTPVPDSRNSVCGAARASAVRAVMSAASALVASMLAMFAPAPAVAQGYDRDCKGVLCLAGGFPTGCGAMSDGSKYTSHAVRYGRPSAASPAGYYCPPEKRLHLTVGDDDGGGRGAIAAC